MNIITVLFVGFLSGALASRIVDGRGIGFFGDVCLGILGAIVGGILFSGFGGVGYTFLGSVLTATTGAVVVLGLARAFMRPRKLAKE